LEVVIKIEVKDNNVEQALRVLKRKLQRDGFFKIVNINKMFHLDNSFILFLIIEIDLSISL